MEKLIKRPELLPDTIDRLQEFVLIGKQKLIACEAHLKAIDDVNLGRAVRDQKLEETQDLAGILLYAEAKLGELLKPLSGSTAGTTRVLPNGITKKQSHYAQQLASHPKIIEEAIQNAIKRKDIPRRKEALRAIRKETREKRKAEIPDLPDKSDRYELIHGDILKADVKDDSLDWIITDPPYPKEFIPLIEDLGEFAQRKLKSHGSLICMIGQSYLPKIFEILNKYLVYNWTCAYVMPGDAVKIWPRKVVTGWKPLLWYVKESYKDNTIYDVFRSEEKDKNYHNWGQSESGLANIIEQFTYPGDLICDPFLGGGTTGIVALKMNRLFIGIDNDIKSIETTKIRLEKTL